MKHDALGDKLADRLGSDDRILTVADIEAVLDEVGSVGTGDDEPIRATAPAPARRPTGRRRLCRIREGEQLAGVCTGLAAYAEIRVDWVRTIFVLAAIATAGLFLIVYLVMAFVLPVVPTQEAWTALQSPVGE